MNTEGIMYGDYYYPGEELDKMASGGIPQRYKNMGFTKVGAKKKSTRPGKKWMVLAKKGDQYKVVHGGDSKMKDFKQHGSEKRKDRFWDRMGGRDSAKAKDPFSPLYWHKKFGTWEQGGQTFNEDSQDFYRTGAQIPYAELGMDVDPPKWMKKLGRSITDVVDEYGRQGLNYFNDLVGGDPTYWNNRSRTLGSESQRVALNLLGVDTNNMDNSTVEALVSSPKNWQFSDNTLNAFPDYDQYDQFDGKNGAFAQARKDLGKGKYFMYKGKRYSTNYAGEAGDEKTQEAVDVLKNSLNPEQYKYFEDAWKGAWSPPLSLERDRYGFKLSPNSSPISWASATNVLNPGSIDRNHVNILHPGNRVYVNPSNYDNAEELAKGFLDEFGHNYQVNDQGTAKSLLRLAVDPFLPYQLDYSNSFYDPNATYHVPGTFENEAHDLPRYSQYEANFPERKNDTSNEEKKRGGQMIKRADGSYSRRGLWDNIRANRGSGKKPTKEMLEQERKIRKNKNGGEPQNEGFQALPPYVQAKIMSNMMYGGDIYGMGGAPCYKCGGQHYAQGGIHIDPSKRGTFKAQATRMGMSVQQAANTILNAPEGKYSPEMRRKANFAKNFAKEYGGSMPKYQFAGSPGSVDNYMFNQDLMTDIEPVSDKIDLSYNTLPEGFDENLWNQWDQYNNMTDEEINLYNTNKRFRNNFDRNVKRDKMDFIPGASDEMITGKNWMASLYRAGEASGRLNPTFSTKRGRVSLLGNENSKFAPYITAAKKAADVGIKFGSWLGRGGKERNAYNDIMRRSLSDNLYPSVPMGVTGAMGDWDIFGEFRPDETLASRTYRSEMGGEIEMTDDQIKQLVALGAEIEFLD